MAKLVIGDVTLKVPTKPWKRFTFLASITPDATGALVLGFASGAFVTTLYPTGEREDGRDSHKRCLVNIGDRVLLNGPTLDEIAVAEVVYITQDSTPRVRIRCGMLLPTTRRAHVSRLRSRP